MKNDYIGILPTVAIPAKPKVADNTLFIMGNGPSLRGLDFQRFNGYPTLGMNVAFRHWHKINWYPTYYICLDTVVTESQKDGICKLVQEQDKNGIRMFLLRRNLLKFYPKLKDNPSVLFFEDYLHAPAFEGVEPLFPPAVTLPCSVPCWGTRESAFWESTADMFSRFRRRERWRVMFWK
jgi:hypothetical protein